MSPLDRDIFTALSGDVDPDGATNILEMLFQHHDSILVAI